MRCSGWINLLDDSAFAAFDEGDEFGDVFAFEFADFFDGLGGVELACEEDAEGFVELLEAILREAAAGETDLVDAEGVHFPALRGEREGEDVLRNGGAAADEGITSDGDVLMDRVERADGGVVLDSDVAREGGGVGEDAMIADDAVMADVDVGHDEAVGADLGDSVTLDGAATDGDALANGGVCADGGCGWLAFVLEVLRGNADGGKGVDFAARADGCVAIDYDMGDQDALLSQHNVGADGAEGADGAGLGNLRPWRDDSTGMDAHSLFPSTGTAGAAAVASASPLGGGA